MNEKTSGPVSPLEEHDLGHTESLPAEATTSATPASAPANTTTTPNEPKKVSFQEEEAPPARPPRRPNQAAEAESTLIEAFPAIDPKVIKAVLVASGGMLEPAFNALLGMSDPTFVAEQPRIPSPQPARRELSQVESDELLARRLARQYDSSTRQGRGAGRVPSRQADAPYEEPERSFFDDELPEIRRNIEKGFQETQKTVNKWLTSFKKTLNGDEDDEDDALYANNGGSSAHSQQRRFPSSQSQQGFGTRSSTEQSRRSGERERYDADPRVLSDDFRELNVDDHEVPGPRLPPRGSAEPNLSRPGIARSAKSNEQGDQARSDSPAAQGRGPSASNTPAGKKWQPLASVAPAPLHEDNDPFSLGDSDEEDAKKPESKPHDTKA